MPDVHHQPVEHVKVEVVGEVLRNPFPLRLFEPSKPSRAEFLVPAFWAKICGVEPVQGSVFGEHPNSPNSSQPLPVDQLYVCSLLQVFISDFRFVPLPSRYPFCLTWCGQRQPSHLWSSGVLGSLTHAPKGGFLLAKAAMMLDLPRHSCPDTPGNLPLWPRYQVWKMSHTLTRDP